MQNHSRRLPNPKAAGFTITEVLVAFSIGSLVLVVVLNTFLWCAKQAVICTKSGWSQREAMVTSEKLSHYIRNASEIIDIDVEQGAWVTLRQSDGTFGTLVYSNAVPLLRDGRLFLQREDGTEMIVTRGLTEIQEGSGFTTPIFIQTDVNALRVAFRVSEPVESGGRDANDGAFAACVRFSACLRNSNKTQ